MQEKLTKLLKDRRMLGGLGAAILIIVIAVLIHGRTVNVLQNKYFEPKYEGIDTQGYITYKSRYQLYKSIGDILAKKAKLTEMETEAIVGDGSNTSYILDGDKVNDYLEEHYFDLSNTDKEHLSLFKRWASEITISVSVNGKETSTSGLKNGDKVTFEIKVAKDAEKKNPIRASKKTYKVSGLKERKTISLSSVYSNSNLKMKAEGVESKHKSENSIQFSYTGKQKLDLGDLDDSYDNKGYVNGNKVTVKASILLKKLRENNPDYKFTGSGNHTYTVSGLVDKSADYSKLVNYVDSEKKKEEDSKIVYSTSITKLGDLQKVYVRWPYLQKWEVTGR